MARRRGGNIGQTSQNVEISNNSRGDTSEPKTVTSGLVHPAAAAVSNNQQTNSQTSTENVVEPSASAKTLSPIVEKQDDVIPILNTGTVGKSKSQDGKETSTTRESSSTPWRTKPKVPVYKAEDTEFDSDHLAKVDISKRRGNYLLSVGLPRSGKTVLQSYMTYYMDVAGTLNAELDIRETDGTINHEAQKIKTVWLESWKRGELPDSTPVGEDEIRELRLDVTNKENNRQNFNLSFLEISGENFLNVVPNEQNIPRLFERLKLFLTNKRINLTIAFVLKPNDSLDPTSCDALFTNFITFIRNELNINISKRAGLVLVLPNTKEIFGKDDWQRSRKDQKFYGKLIKDYIYQNFPATYKIYDDWRDDKSKLMSFYIGDVEGDRLLNQDFDDVKGLIRLNYQLFTGKKLQPKYSLIKRLLGS